MKTIVMTGATSGIGLETAYLLAGLGFRIIGVGHTPERCACANGSSATRCRRRPSRSMLRI